MSKTTRSPQEIQFELLRLSSFNGLSGDLVADSLEKHRGLWRGWILDRAGYYAVHARENGANCDPVDDIKLRDIEHGYWNVDTLYILPAEGKEDVLKQLVSRLWGADEIDWQNYPNAGKVLRVWWD